MKAYTEGPWEVRIWDGEDWPEKRISVGATDGGHSVCVSPRYRWNLEDFNLIAAAPDLYEALDALVEVNDEPCWTDHHGYCQAHYMDNVNAEGCRVAKARAVIAKARGE